MPDLDIAQIIGLIALTIGATNFLNRNDVRFRWQMTVFCYILTVHFFMMGAITGAIVSFLSGTRSAISVKSTDSRIMIVFISLFWIIGLPNASHWYEALPVLGSSVATFALFRKSGIPMRLLIGINSFCWLTHNILVGSIGGVMMELLFITFNLYTIYRIHQQNLRSCAEGINQST